MSIVMKTRNSTVVNKTGRDMEKCKFVNKVNLSQSCDQPGRFRKESYHPEWPFDQDYLCDRHYKQVKTRVMRKG